jgi:glycosyltransferase involved in cell wall biosynthesis
VSLLSVVVPVYKNAPQLQELLERLRRACGTLQGIESEYVFVDDGSPDASFAVLSRLAEANPQVRVIRLSRNFGSNLAILAGLSYARGDAVAIIAADLQDPPELLPEMVSRWKDGAEVVLAARRTRDDPWLSRLFSSAFNRLFKSLVFRDFPKGGFDFALLDRLVVRSLIAMPEKHSYLFGQIMWLGFQRAVIPYDRQRRPDGRSGWTLSSKIKYFIDAFTAFSYLPVRVASVTGFALAALGFAYAALVIVLRLLGGIQDRGFSALMVVLLVVSGTQLMVMGIVGEYLWRILEEVRPRPPFVVAQAINVVEQEPVEIVAGRRMD